MITPTFAGLAPGFAGLYQVVLQVPPLTRPGTYTLQITSRNSLSNLVNLPVSTTGLAPDPAEPRLGADGIFARLRVGL